MPKVYAYCDKCGMNLGNLSWEELPSLESIETKFEKMEEIEKEFTKRQMTKHICDGKKRPIFTE